MEYGWKQAVWTTVIVLSFTLLASSDAHCEERSLHHELQVVTGGRVMAQAYVERAAEQILRARVLARFTIEVEVVPHSGATTIKVTVISRGISARNEGRIREILERTVRERGVVMNGYWSRPQQPSSAVIRFP